jgi:hypothetical protein
VPGHDLVRRYPDRFRRQKRGGRAKRAKRNGHDGRFEVTLWPAALRVIRREIFLNLLTNGCELETGSGLFAAVSGRSGIVIRAASVSGGRSKRGRTQLLLDLADLRSQAYFRQWRDRGEHLCGDWHTHGDEANGEPDDGVPSVADVRCWRRRLDEGCDRWLGITATRGTRGWTKAKLHAWLVTPDNIADPVPVN